MIHTKLCDLLGIQFPIIQGGMGWIADGQLAGSVSKAGGLGIIACASAEKEDIRKEIHIARSITNKPMGMNIIAKNPNALDMTNFRAQIIAIPVCPSPILAKKMQDLGADAVVVEGCEAGGHVGEMTTMSLVPQTVDLVSIPVIAAGGIADGRTAAAAFILGAEGIQLGTYFTVCKESNAHENYKETIIKSNGWDTVVTGRLLGHPIRSINNDLIKRCIELERNGQFQMVEEITHGSPRKAVKEGNLLEGSFMSGQSCGLITKKNSASEIIRQILSSAENYLSKYPEHIKSTC